MKTFGQLLNYKRQKLGLTKKSLGEKLGVAAPVVFLWEKNKREPKARHVALLMKILDINKRDFLKAFEKNDASNDVSLEV